MFNLCRLPIKGGARGKFQVTIASFVIMSSLTTPATWKKILKPANHAAFMADTESELSFTELIQGLAQVGY